MGLGGLLVPALGLAAAWLLGLGFEPSSWLLPFSAGRGRLLSPAELARHTGAPGSPGLYLAVLGQVFDVRRGHKHYGPGAAYSVLAGKDASRAFATGDFTNTGLVDDVSGLSPSEILTIQNWLSFYSENYIFVGKLVGRFYDENGAPTKALEQAKAVIEEALKFKEQNNEKKQFPPCNSEWSSTSGSRFWCSKQSYSGASHFEEKLHGLDDTRHLPSVTSLCTHGFAYFISINFQLSITFHASEVNWFGKNMNRTS
ncbi:neuferricin isoform X2 [Gopherus evgoodei]|uniref:neuferricin isoform X2 n=1 Tax=Gopherus evgoodei TaxID=1825980 RepID=UPI0011D00CB1|nr:neuferricin isoform X2 [Gopherus evgoodei]